VFYCSKDCQRSDWKANHKKYCIAKADRVPQPGAPLTDFKEAPFKGEDCSICLDPVAQASVTTLPCAHVFHAACVAELRKFKLKQSCPLCRAPLPPGPEKLHEDATLRYFVIERRVERGKASWSALTKDEQQELQTVVDGWRAAAAQGHVQAQYYLGFMLAKGRGVAQSDAEAARWYRKAADQGHAHAQHDLGINIMLSQGSAQSDAEAMRWFRKAADQGLAHAQFSLGWTLVPGPLSLDPCPWTLVPGPLSLDPCPWTLGLGLRTCKTTPGVRGIYLSSVYDCFATYM